MSIVAWFHLHVDWSYAGPAGHVLHGGERITAMSTTGGDVMAALRKCGYLPHSDTDGCITLRNCPFHSVAKDHLEVVCRLNLELVGGVVAGSAPRGMHAQLKPRPGRCCVVVHGTASARDEE
jgi:predicted ArsR family transcriptional regulator